MSDQVLNIDEIHADPANVRRHPERNRAAIAASLARFRPARSIVVDKDNVVRAGSGTLEAARLNGIDKVRIVEPEDGELIAVRRADWTPSEATAYAIADNRTAELAEWDETAIAETLRALQSEDFNLDAIGYDADEVDELIEQLADEALANGEPLEDPCPQIDRVEELQQKWSTATGQLWIIPSKATPGKEHRLLCGDSTKADDVSRVMMGKRSDLMATDPPYNCNYQGSEHQKSHTNHPSKDKHHKHYQEIGNQEEFVDFLRVAIDCALSSNPAIYQWHPHDRQTIVEQAWRACGLLVHQQIIWLKSRPVLTHSHYMIKHEPCLYGWIKGNKPSRIPDAVDTTVWPINHQGRHGVHPTEKPIEIFAKPMKYHLTAGGICFEPFSGSGTQFVAAEQTGRLCYGIEIAPEFIAVALERLVGIGLVPSLQLGN